MKKRENGLDLLRLIAISCVVFGHTGTVELNIAKKMGSGLEYYFFTGARSFFNWSVAAFFLMSGAFVLAAESTKDYQSFYKKTWKKLCIPTIVFTMIYLIVLPFENYKAGWFGNGTDSSELLMSCLYRLKATLSGLPAEHMWYMFTLIVLYLMAPFVVRMKEVLGEKGFQKAAVILWIWGTASNTIYTVTCPDFFKVQNQWGLDKAINLLGIFMMGYVVHQWAGRKKESGANGTGFLLLSGGIGVELLRMLITWNVAEGTVLHAVFAENVVFSVLNVISAMMFVAAFTIIDIKKDFGYLSALTYWVYLVHPLVISLTRLAGSWILGISYREFGRTNRIVTFIVQFIVVYLLSFVCGHLIESFQRRKRKIRC